MKEYDQFLMKLKSKNRLISKSEAAERLGVSTCTITRYIKRGVLQTANFDGSDRVLISDVNRFSELMDSKEAAEILGVSSRTVLRKMKAGSIPYVYYHKSRCCTLRDVMKFAETHKK